METEMKNVADSLFKLRASAAELRKMLKDNQTLIDDLEMSLIDALSRQPETSRTVRVPAGSITAVWKSRAEIEDQAVFHQHILDTRNLSLLQNRVSEANVKKVWESGDDVPGVARTDVMDLSYSAAKIIES